jgi:hypothetical protein
MRLRAAMVQLSKRLSQLPGFTFFFFFPCHFDIFKNSLIPVLGDRFVLSKFSFSFELSLEFNLE